MRTVDDDLDEHTDIDVDIDNIDNIDIDDDDRIGRRPDRAGPPGAGAPDLRDDDLDAHRGRRRATRGDTAGGGCR